jgi:hypothetical protein
MLETFQKQFKQGVFIMNTIKRVMCVGLMASICGCAWLQSNQQILETDATAEVNCVVNAGLAGQTVEQIAVNCGGLAVEAIISLLDNKGVKIAPSPALSQVRAAQALRLGR